MATSPRRASGKHTIRVRVTGTKRDAATHDWATVDRFQITKQPVVGTNYRIVNRNSGKSLAVAGGSTADGAKVVQRTDGGAWTINAAPGGAYTLNYVSTGKALDVDGFSSTVGLQLQQWRSTGDTNQQWYLRSNDDGYFTSSATTAGWQRTCTAGTTATTPRSCSGPPAAAPTSNGSWYRRDPFPTISLDLTVENVPGR
ncbi:RICIN domain-containing protein [Streptomyces europaeiscabiei]|uniref:RICIN domain-containing protein n=1 Tax=Streptomyces europaeiscabiei TaxID=146819 RepID=UPI0039906212|nr:RICIN domain-containing protein [Streptomyces europaeiscabiei]